MASDSEETEFLTVEDLVGLAAMLLGDPPPVRDMGSSAQRPLGPRPQFFGTDAYPDIWAKAAALLQSVVESHALVDGNKRLGRLATAVFLEINGVPVVDAPNDGVYDLVVGVAAGNATVGEIATALRPLLGGDV